MGRLTAQPVAAGIKGFKPRASDGGSVPPLGYYIKEQKHNDERAKKSNKADLRRLWI